MHVRFEGLLHVVVELDVLRIVQIGDAEQLFDAEHAFFGEADAAVLFVDGVVAGGVLYRRALCLRSPRRA